MTIKIADQFEVLTAAPIDRRMVVDSYDDLQYIDELVKYEGMVVYALLEKSRYILKDGNFVLIDPVSNTLIRQQFLITAYNVLPNDHSPLDRLITTNFQLMQIEADAPCRVRIYASEDGRSNDIARAFGTAVDPYNGMFVDFVITTPNTVYNIAPSVMVFSESDSEFSRTRITITNLDVTQKEEINVTLTYVNFGIPQIESLD